ncbi:MAG: hydantoinase/oxoprolinase N-terminal domain-containing protein, partial [Alphaproteobacteria bacterium]
MSEGAKLAVDIGGTFTDLVLERDGTQHQTKLLTTSAAPE